MARRNDDRAQRDAPKEFEEVLLEVRRVTRVTTGGRQLSFRATILVGNKKGKIGVGVSKGPDVQIAVKKATKEAYKSIIDAPISDSLSVPYQVVSDYKSSRVKLIPATSGTGLKAGSAVRVALDLAGYSNMLSKIMGSNNKLNNVLATIKALSTFKPGRFLKVKQTSSTPVIVTDDVDSGEVATDQD